MGRVLGYWRFIAGNAWRNLRRQLGGWGGMMWFVIHAAFYVAVLYLAPWMGDFSTEVRLLAAAGIGFGISAPLFYFGHLAAAAAENDKRRQDLIVDLAAAVISAGDQNGAVERMIESLRDGERLFSSKSAQWDETMGAWEAKFDRMMAANFKAGFRCSLTPNAAERGRSRDYYRAKLDLISKNMALAEAHWLGADLLNWRYGELMADEPVLVELARKRAAEGRRP